MIFQFAAIIIMLVFYGAYFSKLLCQRNQGIQTDLLGKGKTGFVKFIEITLKITTYLVPIFEIISIVFNMSKSNLWLKITGVIFAALGVFVFVISMTTMRNSWRAGVPQNEKTELVTSGIYRYSRNPAFWGFDMMYIGILMAFFNWWLCAITTLAVLMLHLQIVNVEEDYLIVTFGDEYLSYKKKVCRYWGRKK